MTKPLYRVDIIGGSPGYRTFFVRARDAEDAKRFLRSIGPDDLEVTWFGPPPGDLPMRAHRVSEPRRRNACPE